MTREQYEATLLIDVPVQETEDIGTIERDFLNSREKLKHIKQRQAQLLDSHAQLSKIEKVFDIISFICKNFFQIAFGIAVCSYIAIMYIFPSAIDFFHEAVDLTISLLTYIF